MTHPAIALLLLLFLLLVMPVWGWLDMRRLKRLDSTIALTRSYVTTIVAVWLLAALCTALVPASVLWNPPIGLAASMRLDIIPPAALTGITAGVTIGLVIGLMAPVLIARRKPEVIARQLESIRFLLPKTKGQRWLFVLVCVTAGVAEEWIYRGFLLHFLVAELPAVNGWLLVVAAAAMFGIAHAYQGKTGTFLTGILGFIFSLLYICTGSLLVAMIIHTLLDLRIFLLLPYARKTTA